MGLEIARVVSVSPGGRMVAGETQQQTTARDHLQDAVETLEDDADLEGPVEYGGA